MQRLFLMMMMGLLAGPAGAGAQLVVHVQMERDTRLLYESIPVVVGIRNSSGRALELGGDDKRSWLGFLITDEAGRTVAPVGAPGVEESMLIAVGQTLSRTVDLLPRYDLRTRGTYRVQAVVEFGQTRVLSPPIPFTIMHGRELWSQTVGLATAPGQPEQSRTYSLLTRRDAAHDLMYVGVRDDGAGVVYGMLPLGVYVALGEPEAQVDRLGHLHVLFRSGARAFHYAHLDPQAGIVAQSVYSNLGSVPRLAISPTGVVSVHGGEKAYPHVERVMTEEELHPPPPPKEKPKKSWWPFHREPRPADTSSTNASAPAASSP